jgi:HlyD family secretion protein
MERLLREDSKMKRTLKNLLIVVIPVTLIGGAIAAIAMTSKGGSDAINAGSVYTVTRGALSINLTESGTIKSRDQFIVKSQVEGRTSVIFVIDEGAVVKKDELLIELDSSDLANRLVDQQIQVENSEADYVTAQENLEVAKIQTQSNIAQASLEDRFAKEDKVKYLDGDWPRELMQSNTDLTLKQEDFRRATDVFEWSKKLYAEKYLSETQYRADELALKRAELQAALAQESLDLLKEFTQPRKLAELDSAITQKALTLERVKREASSDLAQARARLRAREAELKRQKTRLEKIQDQITKTKIFAPADGMVVYATSSEFSWRGDTQPLNEGQEVWERQELIHLPTADSMMLVIRVQESALGKVELGQEVSISIDALPGKQYTGTVSKIAPLPDATSVFMNPDLKVYDTQIMVDGIHQELRTGMSGKAMVLIAEYADALSVPIQAVVGRGGESVVYVIEHGEAVARAVEVGLDNNAMVHIISGLEEGEKVLLTPPLDGNEQRSVNAKKKAMKDEGQGTKPKANRPGSGRSGGGAGGGRPGGGSGRSGGQSGGRP